MIMVRPWVWSTLMLYFNRVTRRGVALFQDFGGKKIVASRDVKMRRFTMIELLLFYIQFNKCVTSFQDNFRIN